jgi:hypothetical protein
LLFFCDASEKGQSFDKLRMVGYGVGRGLHLRSSVLSLLGRLGRFLGGDAVPPPPSPAPAAKPPAAPAFDYSDDRIPDSAKAKIARILASIIEVETAMERESLPSFSRVDTDQMRDVHLPKLVQSYIDIPAAHRSEIFRKTGKSASFLLGQSLDTMQTRIDDMLRNLAQHDLDAFTNNTKFIGQRYADDDNPFN